MCVRIQGKNSRCSQLDIVSVSYIHFLKFMTNYSETSLTFFTENRRQITPDESKHQRQTKRVLL